MNKQSVNNRKKQENSGWFKPGQSGNPNGRPKDSVSGRNKALRVLDEFLSQENIQQELKDAFTNEFTKNPIRFFARYVMPLLPKSFEHTGNIGLEHSFSDISDDELNRLIKETEGRETPKTGKE